MRGRKERLACTGITLLGLMVLAGAAPTYFRFVRSAPLAGAEVDFQAATRSDWKLTVASQVGADRPDLRLEITNHSKTTWLFPDNGGGSLILERADGTQLKSSIRARALRRIDWLLVSPGETYTSLCQVEVKCLPGGTTRQLTYTSADGTMFSFEPLEPGKYKLRLRYENSISQSIDGQQTWVGKAETAPVEFEILE